MMTLTAGLGLAAVVLSGHAAFAIGGLLLMGFGTSALFPMALSAAARLTDRSPAANVASLSQLAFLAGVATPLIIGLLVQLAGIRVALASGSVLLLVGLLVLLTRHPFEEGHPATAQTKGARSSK